MTPSVANLQAFGIQYLRSITDPPICEFVAQGRASPSHACGGAFSSAMMNSVRAVPLVPPGGLCSLIFRSGGLSPSMLRVLSTSRRESKSRCRRACSRPTRMKNWRRGWDSNPRYGYPYNGFRDRPIRPLWHLSGRLDHAPMAVGSGTFIVLVPWRQLKGSPNRPQAHD